MSWFSHRQVFLLTDFRRNKILTVLNKASALVLPDNEDCQTKVFKWSYRAGSMKNIPELWAAEVKISLTVQILTPHINSCDKRKLENCISNFKLSLTTNLSIFGKYLLLEPPCGTFVAGWLWQLFCHGHMDHQDLPSRLRQCIATINRWTDYCNTREIIVVIILDVSKTSQNNRSRWFKKIITPMVTP